LRRHAIAEICALWLVTLILTPCTAPFKTYDLAKSQSDHSYDGLPKDKVGSDDKLANLSDESPTPPVLDIVRVKPFVSPNQIEEHRLRTTILRV
jgi:hypothetical protein